QCPDCLKNKQFIRAFESEWHTFLESRHKVKRRAVIAAASDRRLCHIGPASYQPRHSAGCFSVCAGGGTDDRHGRPPVLLCCSLKLPIGLVSPISCSQPRWPTVCGQLHHKRNKNGATTRALIQFPPALALSVFCSVALAPPHQLLADFHNIRLS